MKLSDEDKAELTRVVKALRALSLADTRWQLNLTTFSCMSFANQYRWWCRAKAQARKGVPAMQTLLAKVIELRLTGK